jgi:hypothetical protein
VNPASTNRIRRTPTKSRVLLVFNVLNERAFSDDGRHVPANDIMGSDYGSGDGHNNVPDVFSPHESLRGRNAEPAHGALGLASERRDGEG